MPIPQLALDACPSPAVLITGDPDGVTWRPNAAALGSAVSGHWSSDQWCLLSTAVAAAMAGQPADSVQHGRLEELGVVWRGVAVEGGRLAWLQPVDDPQVHPPEIPAEHRVARLTMQSRRIGYWRRDLIGGHVRSALSLSALFGENPAPWIPGDEGYFLAIHPDDRAASTAAYRGSFLQPGLYQTRYRLFGAQSSLNFVHDVWEVIADADGRPAMAAGMLIADTASVEFAERHQANAIYLQLLVGMVGVSLWRIDLATGRQMANEFAFKRRGLPPRPEGITPAEVRSYLHPDDFTLLERANHQAVSGHGFADATVRARMPDGSFRVMRTRRVAERDAFGNAIGLFGVSDDVTDHEAALREVQEINASIAQVAQAAGIGIWRADPLTGLTNWNEPMMALFGGTVATLDVDEARQRVLVATFPEDRAKVRQLFDAASRHEPLPEDFEIRIRTYEEGVRHLVCRTHWRMVTGSRMAIGVMIDVTEHRQAQEHLRIAEHRALLIGEMTEVGFFDNNPLTRTSTWDRQMYRLRGVSEDDPRSIDDIRRQTTHPDDRVAMEQYVTDAFKDKYRSTYHYQFRVIWPDGSVHRIASRGYMFRDEAGRVVRAIGVNWDPDFHHRPEPAAPRPVLDDLH